MYPTNITDSQWEVISSLFDTQRKRKYSLQEIINAIFYLTRSGVQWRMLPKDFPPYGIVYYYFRSWQISGLWERINRHVVEQERIKQDRPASPSVGIIDSQSIKNRERGLGDKGFDGHKKIKGRKRHLIIDSLGLVLAVMVGPANNHDACAAKILLQKLALVGFERMKIIIGDGAYEHLAEWLKENLKWVLQIFKRSDTAKTPFEVLPQRWKVERTISWLMWSRRLSLDYEADTRTSETFVLIANIYLILRKT
jgi:transposase